jgi:signal transduction histidine kinase
VGTLRDITKEEEHLHELRSRDSILAAVGKAGQTLMLTPPEKFARAITETLRLLGTAADVSRAYIFEAHTYQGRPVASQRFEWVAQGVSAEIDNPLFQNFPMDGSVFADAIGALNGGMAIQQHLSDLPAAERQLLDGQGIQSLLFVPVFLHKQFWGMVAFDECKRQRVWSAAEVDALRIAAGLLGAAMERNQAKIAQKEAADEALRSREEVRLLRRHAETVREAEQKRLAHRLHDDFGQCLTMLTKDLVWLRGRPGSAAPEVQERIAQDLALIADLLASVRDISMELRPAVLDHFGLGAAVEWAAERFSKTTGIRTDVRIGDATPLAKEREYSLFRILQELLTNAAKHSQASRVRISLAAKRDTLVLTVADNGVGLKEGIPSHKGALGLLGVRERAISLGGAAEFLNGKKGGAAVSVRVPIRPPYNGGNHEGHGIDNQKDTRP